MYLQVKYQCTIVTITLSRVKSEVKPKSKKYIGIPLWLLIILKCKNNIYRNAS